MQPITLFAKIQAADANTANLTNQRMLAACAGALDKLDYNRLGAKHIQFRLADGRGLYMPGDSEGFLEKHLKENHDFPSSTKVSMRLETIDVSAMHDDTSEWVHFLYVEITWE